MKRLEFTAGMVIAGVLLMSAGSEATLIDNFSLASGTTASFNKDTGNNFSTGFGGLSATETLGGVRELALVKDPVGSVSLWAGINHAGSGLYELRFTQGLHSSTTTLQYDGINDIGGSNFSGPDNLNFDLAATEETALKLKFGSIAGDVDFTISMTDGTGAVLSIAGTATAGNTTAFRSITPILASSLDTSDIDDITITLTTHPQGVFDLDSIELVVGAIPEPSSMALMATGVLGLIGYSRRRRKDKAVC